MSKALLKHSRKITILFYFIILALVVAIAYSLQRQTSFSIERKAIEVGLIESGGRPTLYFNLKNIEGNFADYRYIVTYNSTDKGVVIDLSTITLPPTQTFGYTISLVRPSYGIMVLNLKIYRLDSANGVLLHDQTWIIRVQS